MVNPLNVTIVVNLKSLIRIEAAVEPVPFKRAIPGKPVHNDKRYTEYKDVLGYFALKAMAGRPPLTGAIKLSVDFFKLKPKKSKYVTGNEPLNPDYGDLDNHVKSVMDALTGICYDDDRQVCEIHARKFFGQPNIIITLEMI